MQRRALLLVLDGAGWREETHGNAVTRATLPTLFARGAASGMAVLEASGESVGLERGQVGNSEAGHLTLGAGRVVPSMTRRLLEAHTSGSWARDPAWARIRERGVLHLVGLVSDAGVHGLGRTLVHAAASAAAAGVREVHVHPVLDGIDSVAGSAPRLLAELQNELAAVPGARLGVVQGRKAFCDRSGDLAVSRACADALLGRPAAAPFEEAALARHLTSASEASFPAHLVPGGRPLALGEPVLLTSHRADRARQIATLLAETQPLFALVELGKGVAVQHVFFPTAPLAEGVFSELKRAGLASLRIAEKCKFPHVTFFLNGFDAGAEGRGICLDSIPEAEIPCRPEMSAAAVTDEIVRALGDPTQRAVIANLANLDQVGHLGDVALAVRAAATVDACYGRIASEAERHGWTVLVTSDHGNADTLIGPDGGPFGSHSHSPVPLFVAPAPGLELRWHARRGSLANVAATFLDALGLPRPSWMEPPLLAFVPSVA
jgi:2,3-bisphosphoglycerate-independent phosphoglycerate mutase